MIKIIQVISDTNVGGAGRYLLNYLKYYDASKFRVFVVVPENSKLISFIREINKPVEIIEAPFMADESYDKRCVEFLTKKFSEIKPDIVHTHASLSARLAARRSKCGKIIATRHCIEPDSGVVKAFVSAVFNNRLCDVYVAVSDAVKQNLIADKIAKNKIRTVYNGVNAVKRISEERIKELKKQYGIENAELILGIFARVEPVKGHKFLIKAVKNAVKRGYDIRLLVVGEGSLLEAMKKLTRDYNIEKNVIFTGYVSDTTELLNIIDVNVLSSDSEAMSLSILEAMSLGKPTIATACGGNVELIKNNSSGLLVPVADSSSLSEAIVKILDNKELLQKFSQNAKSDYDSKFTAEIMVSNLEKLYLEVVKC